MEMIINVNKIKENRDDKSRVSETVYEIPNLYSLKKVIRLINLSYNGA